MSYNNPPPYSQGPGYTPASTYQPGQPPMQSTVIIQTTRPAVALGNGPSRVVCPSCHAEVLTTVEHEATGKTHCWALLLCLLIMWPCVCLPYCMDSCKDATHYCPNCRAYLGRFSS